jgi:predicted NBD/HSP70 family sugar kinase
MLEPELKTIENLKLIPSSLTMIREVHRCGATTRVDIAKNVALSTQSVTRITKELLDAGILVEGERRNGGRGQPAIYLTVAPGRFVSFGLVFEHDRITCAAYDLTGEELFLLKQRGNFDNAQQVVEVSRKMLAAAVAQVPDDAFALGVGISISGFFTDPISRRFISRNDVDGWRQFDLAVDFHPPVEMPVFIENDGRAAAIGQAINGVAKGYQSFFLILMTKGLGGGFVNAGQLIRGRQGNAGEVAVMVPPTPSTKRPTDESLKTFLLSKWGSAPTSGEIERALLQQDADVLEWIAGAAETMSPIVNTISALFDPAAIILAGRLLPSVRQAIADRLQISGVNYMGYEAMPPAIIVDPRTDCLTVGAACLPIAAFLGG